MARAARTVAAKTLFETSFLIETNATVNAQVDAFTQLEQSYPFKVADGAKDMFP